MNNILKGFLLSFKAFVELLKLLPTLVTKLLQFLCDLWRALKRGCHRPPRGGCCVNLPPGVHVRADPMIYDQYFLISMGLAVTWDNPDIQLFDTNGNLVSPYDLNPNTDYKVVVRIWNNSYDAPAAGLPVILSFLSFGIGISSNPVGATSVNLGVKGSPRCPAFANFVWHTPATPGHYCLQAALVWPDDANPFNNLGQKNTQVGKTQSPAVFSIDVQNQATVRMHFDIEVDTYQLPELPPCAERQHPPKQGRYAESRARWDAALRMQRYGSFPVAPEWNVSVNPSAFDLAPNASTKISVSVEPATTAFVGTQLFNIHGFASPSGGPRALAGGVTLYVQAR
jgi:hypothetical protein